MQELAGHDFIGFGDNDRLIHALNEIGLTLTTENFHVGSKSGLVAWEMARSGLGIVIMSDNVGSQADDMEQLLPDMKPLLFPIWLTAHRELHTSRRIRVVFDVLAAFLTAHMIK